MQLQFGPKPEADGGSLLFAVTSLEHRSEEIEGEGGAAMWRQAASAPSLARFLNYGHYTCEQRGGGGRPATVATGLAIIEQGCRTD